MKNRFLASGYWTSESSMGEEQVTTAASELKASWTCRSLLIAGMNIYWHPICYLSFSSLQNDLMLQCIEALRVWVQYYWYKRFCILDLLAANPLISIFKTAAAIHALVHSVGKPEWKPGDAVAVRHNCLFKTVLPSAQETKQSVEPVVSYCHVSDTWQIQLVFPDRGQTLPIGHDYYPSGCFCPRSRCARKINSILPQLYSRCLKQCLLLDEWLLIPRRMTWHSNNCKRKSRQAIGSSVSGQKCNWAEHHAGNLHSIMYCYAISF